jgi:hypothetical protein
MSAGALALGDQLSSGWRMAALNPLAATGGRPENGAPWLSCGQMTEGMRLAERGPVNQ